MNFFKYQEQARRQTRWLVLAFLAATASVAWFSFVMIYFAFWLFAEVREPFWISLLHSEMLFPVVGTISLLMLSGTLYKIYELKKGGGEAVAEMMGGKRIASNTQDRLERRLLNVTEEMAIASGVPVPPVYLLPEDGINAFAAGFSASDAVIGVTRGAIELLDRDQLQGVLGHEFSHILNQDILINMRMMGTLHGITLVGDAGVMLFRGMARSSSRSSRQGGVHPAIVIVAISLIVVSGIGSLFAGLIKSAVSRQREFLADASSVQFTRYPQGLANALKLIGGYGSGTKVRHPRAASASYMFFGNVGRGALSYQWFATHPKLEDRIKRLDRHFNSKFYTLDVPARKQRVMHETALGLNAGSAGYVHDPDRADSAHEISWSASDMIAAIPAQVYTLSHDPTSARAVIYALLTSRDKEHMRQQMNWLIQHAEKGVYQDYSHIMESIRGLDAGLRIAVLDICIATLKQLSKPQYQQFIKNTRELIRVDGCFNAFEFVLQQMLMRHLAPTFSGIQTPKVKYRDIHQLIEPITLVVALIAASGRSRNTRDLQQRMFYRLGIEAESREMGRIDFSALAKALRELDQSSDEIKEKLIGVCEECVLLDGVIDVAEYEMIRAVADGIGVPMPPLQTAELKVT